ncbi:RCC1/BLIP-II [Xylariaceae sp. FL0804]|nr:RCC1/BLIP-II [Xylariaceae sp. FL0804]
MPRTASKVQKKAAPAKSAAPTKPAAPAKPSAPAAKVNGVKKPAAKVNGVKEPAAAKPTTKRATAAEKPVKSSTKRQRRDDDEGEEEVASAKPVKAVERPTKKAKQAHEKSEDLTILNDRPTQILDLFVFGDGEFGELGLGNKKFEGKKPAHVKLPQLNQLLSADKVGVVQIAAGGMHAAALTDKNKILTWGVNDEKALGRETNWEGDDDDDEDVYDDAGLDPTESTPGEVDMSFLKEKHQFVQVAATNNATFVLTDVGTVYGWGTFRGSDGVFGFTPEIKNQATPMQIEDLKDITALAAGSDHMLALDKDGKVFTWGTGDQFQLGRKPVSRHAGPKATLLPGVCGRFTKTNHAIKIGAGAYHSFYIDNHGRVHSWGLNNFAQTGHVDAGGRDNAIVAAPKLVQSLKAYNITQIDGGEHHSVACSAQGETFAWGRIDFHQVGLPVDTLPEEDTVFDEGEKPRILNKPTILPDLKTKFVACNANTNIVITQTGDAYAWGASANRQTGIGKTEDVELPTKIKSTDMGDKKMVWAGVGGQYGMLASVHKS